MSKGEKDESKKGSKKSKLSGSTSATNTITKTSTHTSNIRIPAQWNAAALMQLEVSLQHWFRRHKKTSMTLEEFYALVKKLDWSQTKTKEEEDANNRDHDVLSTTSSSIVGGGGGGSSKKSVSFVDDEMNV